MAIVKCHDRKRGVTYVYDSTCFYDEEQKKYRYKRRLLGKVDPETGEMIPTGARGGYHPRREKTEEENEGQPMEKLKPGRKKKPKPEVVSSDEAVRSELEKLRSENQHLKEQVESLQLQMVAERKAHEAFAAEHRRLVKSLYAVIPPVDEP